MHEIIQRDYAYSDGKLLEQWYREVNTQIRSIIEHINNTPQAVDWTPQLQQIVARLTTLESVSPSDFSAEIQQIVARLDVIESANAQTQTDLSQIRTEIVEIQNMLASLVGTPVSPPPAAEFSGTVSLTSGIATFGQVIPEGQIPSGSYVKVGSLTTQNDIKTTWDDGSIRFVVLTCEPGSDGDYALSRDNTSQASAMTPPAIPSNTYVELDIGGSVYRATCPTTHSSDKWLDGSLCVESRFEVIPILVSDGTTEHGFLRVIFDVRSYSVSEYRLDVTVENCLDKSGADAITYDAEIFVNGSSQFTSSDITHGYLARWRHKFVSGFTESVSNPDVTLMENANAIPTYFRSGRNPTYSVSDTSKYKPMGTGALTVPMDQGGGRPEIAPYPDWTAEYLVNQSDSQREHLLYNGDLAGTWSSHVRNTGDNVNYAGLGSMGFINIDEAPLYWIHVNSNTGMKPLGNLASGRTFLPDVAHQPSLAYIPYLISGDRYYNDEMAYWAIFCLASAWPYGSAAYGQSNSSRGVPGSKGELVHTLQQRATAWGLRNIVDASIYVADSSVKTHLQTKVTNNLIALDYVESNDTTPLGTLFVSSFDGIRPQTSFASWQNNYIAWSIDHAHKQGYSRANGYDCMLKLITVPITLWNLDDAIWDVPCPFYVDVREYPPLGVYHDNWGDVYVQTYGDVPTGSPTNIPTVNNSSGIDHRLAALIAIQEGLTNAQQYHDFIYGEIHDGYIPNSQFSADLYYKLGWSIIEL